MNRTRNTLPQVVREKASTALNHIVADLFELSARIHQAHWNVRETTFIGLHKLLDEFVASTMNRIEFAAERATALGRLVEGTLRDSVKRSQLKQREEPASKTGLRDWILELAEVHAASGEHVRSAMKQMTGAEDFAAPTS
jgi:starvation-inducible DNA-binding protein